MSSHESPNLSDPRHTVTADDIRSLTAAATPHFALQVRERVSKLISDLPADSPVRIAGEEQIERLAALGNSGEVRGTQNEPTLEPLNSVTREP
jgi:hypothetical protein